MVLAHRMITHTLLPSFKIRRRISNSSQSCLRPGRALLAPQPLRVGLQRADRSVSPPDISDATVAQDPDNLLGVGNFSLSRLTVTHWHMCDQFNASDFY